MKLNVPIEVFVVLLGHREDANPGGPSKYEFIGVADSFLSAQQVAYHYIGSWPGGRSFTWHSDTHATAPNADGSQALVIMKREL